MGDDYLRRKIKFPELAVQTFLIPLAPSLKSNCFFRLRHLIRCQVDSKCKLFIQNSLAQYRYWTETRLINWAIYVTETQSITYRFSLIILHLCIQII